MNKRLKEILERKQELRKLIEQDDNADLNAISTELDEIEAEERQIKDKQNIIERMSKGETIGNVISQNFDKKEIDMRSMNWEQAIETPEYRSAWLNDIAGRKVTEEQRNLISKVNEQYRSDFVHSTENKGVLIPKSVADGIWEKAEQTSSLWADVNKFKVKGILTLVTGEKNKNATWYEESTVVESEELKFGTVELSGYELAKSITVSWKLKTMAINELETYIINELGKRIGAALSYGVYRGKGPKTAQTNSKSEPLGIRTILKNTNKYYDNAVLSYNVLCQYLGEIPTNYSKNTKIYASRRTIWTSLATLTESGGKPLFIADPTNNGIHRLFGIEVKEDAGIKYGEILIGNLKDGYVANIQEDISIYTEDHIKERKTDYMSYAIVDGKPIDENAFVILRVIDGVDLDEPENTVQAL